MRLHRRSRSPYWWLEFRDHRYLAHRISTQIKDERPARAYADKILQLVDFRRAGLDLTPTLTAWVSRMPARRRDHLLKLEIIDATNTTFGTLKEHIEAYQAELETRDLNPMHVQATIYQIEQVWAGAGCLTVEGIRPAAVSAWLKKQRDDGISTSTSNHYLVSAKSFLKWCVDKGRIHRNPLAELRKLKVIHSRRPRALTREEVGKLLATTGGTDRYWLYRLAIETGLRRKQLKSLTAASFDFRANAVRVEASESKAGRKAVLPLRLETAKELRPWLKGKSKNKPVLKVHYRSSEMFARDLHKAKIKRVTPQGTLVFHSLRHTAITEFARAGVHPKIAQRLAQHASIATTMDVYSHVVDRELREAVDKLSKVS